MGLAPWIVAFAATGASGAAPPEPSVTQTTPADQAIGVPLSSSISVYFDANLDGSTVIPSNVLVTSSLRGTLGAAVTWDGGLDRIRVFPDDDFLAGERITVTVTKAVRTNGNAGLPNGHHFEFSTWTAPTPDRVFVTSDTSWSTGSTVVNMTPCDLTGDGRPEAVFSNVIPDSLTILTPDAQASFSLWATVPTGILPRHTMTGDVDGNGWVDLVNCGSGPDEIWVYLNQGAGALDPPVIYATGITPYGGYVGDLDADGDVDVATANFTSDDLSVLLNDGTGGFPAHLDYPVLAGGDSPRWVDGADFDGDGDVDLALCCGVSGDVHVYHNDGSGGMSVQAPRLLVQAEPNFLETRDLDGDGVVDIVTVNVLGPSISLLRGNGDGTFQPAVHFPTTGDVLAGIQVADLDGDLDLDVMVPSRASNAWQPMWNDGTGTFSNGLLYPGGNNCHSLGVADFDVDGDLDAAAGFLLSQDMFFFENAPLPTVVAIQPAMNATGIGPKDPVTVTFNTELSPGTLTPQNVKLHGSQSGPRAASIDWNGPMDQVKLTPLEPYLPGEIVTVTVSAAVTSDRGVPLSGVTASFLAAGATATPLFSSAPVTLPGLSPTAVLAADLDDDDIADLAVANWLSGDITLLLTGPSGSPQVSETFPAGPGTFDLWAGDLDDNGHPDVVAVNTIDSTLSLLFNAGAGVFPPATAVPLPAVPYAVTGGDFDRDGDLDLAVTLDDPAQIRVLWNDGTGSFPAADSLPGAGLLLDVETADLDRDGTLDLVSVNSISEFAQIYLNDPADGFLAPVPVATGGVPTGVFLWDTTGDAFIDLVFSSFSGEVAVLENLQSGATFGPPLLLAAAGSPQAVIGADLDGDLDVDLVSANGGISGWSYLANVGGGTFDPAANGAGGSLPYDIAVGDWNGDGTVDVAIANRASDDLTLLLNDAVTDVTVGGLDDRRPTRLLAASPNPFSEGVSVEYQLARAGLVRIQLFDVRGRLVATLEDGRRDPGRHRARWDGRDRSGDAVSVGVYFLRMEADGGRWARKLLRLR